MRHVFMIDMNWVRESPISTNRVFFIIFAVGLGVLLGYLLFENISCRFVYWP